MQKNREHKRALRILFDNHESTIEACLQRTAKRILPEILVETYKALNFQFILHASVFHMKGHQI